MPTARLPERILLLVDGPDAEHFLQNILTTDLDKLARGEVKPGALLTPQGKILFDFLVSRADETGLVLECRTDIADDFIRRLTLYKLRAQVTISKQDQTLVFAGWQNDSEGSSIESSSALVDTRFPPEAKVVRLYAPAAPTDASAGDYDRLRMAHGVAESGGDYALGDAFPHDVLLDLAGGVGFGKGCYVGQEVVSRMHHRGTARRRVMLVEADGDLPAAGTDLRVNGRPIGTLGTVSGSHGIAIMRIDRVGTALDAGMAIEADGVEVRLSIPAWAGYTLPQGPAAGDG